MGTLIAVAQQCIKDSTGLLTARTRNNASTLEIARTAAWLAFLKSADVQAHDPKLSEAKDIFGKAWGEYRYGIVNAS